jgi:hypothetical protein
MYTRISIYSISCTQGTQHPRYKSYYRLNHNVDVAMPNSAAEHCVLTDNKHIQRNKTERNNTYIESKVRYKRNRTGTHDFDGMNFSRIALLKSSF